MSNKKMVWVVMLATAAGPEFSFGVGERVEVEEGTARAWVEVGAARWADEGEGGQAGVEEATVGARERAVGAREKGRR